MNTDLKAEIITIGDEILIGQVVDTNSAFLATELNKLGISVIQITSIPDMHSNIVKALDDAVSRAELIIITGGLGPTTDDITKPALAEYFGSKMIIVPSVLEKITSLLAARGVKLNERNKNQARVPDNCELLNNSAGTAPGMWFKKKDRDFISLPGVPFEMKAIFQEEMEHRIRQRFSLPAIHHITILTQGVPESQMADMIMDWENKLPVFLKLAYLPAPGILRLRITGKKDEDISSLKVLMEKEVEKLKSIIGQHIFGYDDDKLEVIIGNLLKENNLTLSLAESCSGGTIGSMITSVPGSSAYFRGGIIAYSNEIKISELHVNATDLINNGAVSKHVVEQMSAGARVKFNSDFSIAVSCIAGPSGGTEDKPVGTTWIAVASEKRIVSHVYKFGDNRGRNIQRASITALFILYKEIKNCL